MSLLLTLTILATLALVAYNLLALPLNQAAGVTMGIAAICTVQAWMYTTAASLTSDGLGTAWAAVYAGIPGLGAAALTVAIRIVRYVWTFLLPYVLVPALPVRVCGVKRQ